MNQKDISPEVLEQAAKILIEMLEAKTCIVCHNPIMEKYQIGRCIYAKPCHHRQYQGELGGPKDKN